MHVRDGRVRSARFESDGTATAMPTTYEDGAVSFTTDGHSLYGVCRVTAQNPGGGFPIVPVVIAAVAVGVIAGAVVFFLRRKKA